MFCFDIEKHFMICKFTFCHFDIVKNIIVHEIIFIFLIQKQMR